QRREWAHEGELEWRVTELPEHAGTQRWVADLNRFYRNTPALWQLDFSNEGFEWIDANDAGQSVLTFLRKPGGAGGQVLVACNLTPVPRENYFIGVPRAGVWTETLNSDARVYGGSGWGNLGKVEAAPVGAHGRPYSIVVTLPPLSTIYFESAADG
ncbi:MAG TPA: alpha amylase C-terminal domain-containing protein, partial [Gemmatimonadales bacterium]|nr:alpha amylase C-terminal domain-containing protein [Gemmatimonadales bacterium]